MLAMTNGRRKRVRTYNLLVYRDVNICIYFLYHQPDSRDEMKRIIFDIEDMKLLCGRMTEPYALRILICTNKIKLFSWNQELNLIALF